MSDVWEPNHQAKDHFSVLENAEVRIHGLLKGLRGGGQVSVSRNLANKQFSNGEFRLGNFEARQRKIRKAGKHGLAEEIIDDSPKAGSNKEQSQNTRENAKATTAAKIFSTTGSLPFLSRQDAPAQG